MFESQYISVPEAGKLLGVSATQMHRILDDMTCKIRTVRPTKHRRVNKGDVLRYRDRHSEHGPIRLAQMEEDLIAD